MQTGRARGEDARGAYPAVSAKVQRYPPFASLLLSRRSGLAATEPTLSFLHFFLFSSKSPPFPARRLQLFCGFLRFFASYPPFPILSSFPLSSFPFPSLLLSSLPSSFPFPSGVRLRVSTPRPRPRLVPAPVLRSFVHLHPRSCSRSVPVPMTVHVPVTVSVPAPDSNPTSDPVRSFLSLGPGYPPVGCACTDAGSGERGCCVLASATPCRQRW